MNVRLPDMEGDADGEFELVVHNAESLSGFMACATQWRTAGTMAGVIYTGLDYSACKIVLGDIDAPAHVFGDLRAIEDKVLPIYNEAVGE